MERSAFGNLNTDVFTELWTQSNIFINNPTATEIYNKEGHLSGVNPACLDLFKTENISEVRSLNLFSDPSFPKHLIPDAQSGKSVKYTFEINFDLFKSSTKSGTSILECSLNPLLNPENEIQGYILFITGLPRSMPSELPIHENGSYYQNIFNLISESIFIQNIADGKIVDVNDAMLRMYGYDSKEEILTCNFASLSANTEPFTTEAAINYIRKADLEGKQIFEWLAKRKDGTTFWTEMTLQKAFIDGSNKIIAVGKDISTQKQISRVLAESESKFRNLIQNSSDPIFSINPDETYRFVNKTFANIFGKTPADIIGKKPHEIFSTEEATKRLDLVRNVFKTGEKGEIEVKFNTGDGLTHYYLTMVDPVKNNCGQVLYLTCVSKDITQRKLAEEALIKSEEKFRMVVESSLIGIHFYKLTEGNRLILKDANPAAEKITGIQNHLILGKTIEEAFPNLIYNNLPAVFRKIARGESDPKEFELDYADDRISFFVKIQAFQTELNSAALMFIDISENKKAEKLLEQQTKQLQELNLTKDKFLSIIAHDLKNPFNAIIGFTDLMLNNFSQMDDETIVRGLRTIESASNHAYKLLENLLLWSKNQSGMTEFNPVKLNLHSQITDSLSLVESAAINKNISITIKVKKSTEVFADKNMIDTILRNLISNAIKFSYRGGKIKIVATEHMATIQISVIDEGTGIYADKKEAIFTIDRKTQVLGTEDEQGTGLGLILCKDFVARHEGDIWFENNAKKGATFTFSLPLLNEIS